MALLGTMPLGVCYWLAERAADVWYAVSPRTRMMVPTATDVSAFSCLSF